MHDFRANITLDQTIHGLLFLQVQIDLPDCSALGVGQLEGQVFYEITGQLLLEWNRNGMLVLVLKLVEQASQSQMKNFLKTKPAPGFLELLG